MRKIKRLINIIFINSLMLVDKIFGKKIIIIDLEEISQIPYILPIVEALKQQNKNLQYYISTQKIYLGSEDFLSFKISRQFDSRIITKLPFVDIILTAHIYAKGHKNSKIIHIFHNQPVKYQLYPLQHFQNIHIHFALGWLNRKLIENHITEYKLPNVQIFDVGFPKTDELFNRKFLRNETLKKLSLDENKTTIFYAPSWDEGLSLRSFGVEIIEEILKNSNINLIVKLHPISYTRQDDPNFDFYTGGKDWIKEFARFEKNPNFLHIKNLNLNEILVASDIMITDVSSVAFDFMALDKPIIYFASQDFFDKTLKKTYSEYGQNIDNQNNLLTNAGRDAGLIIKNPQDLQNAIEHSIKNKDEFSQKRKQITEKLYYNKGHASEIAAKTIMKLLNQ